jgi:glycerate dehydrogenase
MKVQYAAHKGRQGQGSLYTPFDDVLATSDIITLHCPLRPSTQHLIGANEFARMARQPLLINTARGGLVDESAVGPALKAGHISGAGFDVTSIEPPSAEHPFMALVGRPDFILTPHVAWASEAAMQTLADQLIDNIEAFIAGKAQNVVDCD